MGDGAEGIVSRCVCEGFPGGRPAGLSDQAWCYQGSGERARKKNQASKQPIATTTMSTAIRSAAVSGSLGRFAGMRSPLALFSQGTG